MSTNPRQRRTSVRRQITRMGNKISMLEGRDSLTERERQTVLDLIEGLPELNSDFRRCQLAVKDQVEDGQDASGEHDVLDEHEDKIDDLTYRLNLLRTIHLPKEPRTLSGNNDPPPVTLAIDQKDKIEKDSVILRKTSTR